MRTWVDSKAWNLLTNLSCKRIKKLQKDGLSEDDAKVGEERVQKLIDGYIKKTDDLFEGKEKEILTV